MTPKELRTRRMDLGWSQKQLADKCGIELKRLLDFEDGEIPIDCQELLLEIMVPEQVPDRGR